MAFRILSIDGGGIKGIIPGQILVALEEKLQKKLDDPHARIGDYFDMIAGTSTGAILGALYICPNEAHKPRFSAKEVVNFYLNEGEKIFKAGFWRTLASLGGLNDEKYSAKHLEKVLAEVFADLTLSKLLKPTCFVSYDISKRVPVIFTQHDAHHKNKDFFVRDLLRASSAAPTYFETAKIFSTDNREKPYICIDGGMVANDPTLCAYSEAVMSIEGVKGIKDMMIVSIGTGSDLHSYRYKDVKNLGLLGWARPAIDIALEGGPQMTEYHMARIASTVKGSKFFRLSPKLYGAHTALDAATAENIRKLKDAGDKNAKDFEKDLDAIIELICS